MSLRQRDDPHTMKPVLPVGLMETTETTETKETMEHTDQEGVPVRQEPVDLPEQQVFHDKYL